MNKCKVWVLCKNEYLAGSIIMCANELGFDADISEQCGAGINVVDCSYSIDKESETGALIYLCDNGKRVPRGVAYSLSKPFLYSDLKKMLSQIYSELYLGQGDRILIENDRLIYKGFSLELTAKEMALFKYLYERADTAVSRTELLEGVWENRASSDANVTDVYVNYIRKKTREVFGIDVIKAVRGLGYMYTGAYVQIR